MLTLFSNCRDEETENMDEWDEEKLDEVIKKKHGSEKSNATDIVSLIFKYTSNVILPLKSSSNLLVTQY